MGKTSASVKNRYASKHYRKYQCNLKFEDADRIDEYMLRHDLNKTDFMLRAIDVLEREEKSII